jgi:NAD(P)-dependent dehydrogenase (short-subunit alcohol dehydrogenase family)
MDLLNLDTQLKSVSYGAGRFGFPRGSAYVSTKFAVEGLSESISYELDKYSLILTRF